MGWCVPLCRYRSELKLVRMKVYESGVYSFEASNGDASVNETFTVHVISKLTRHAQSLLKRLRFEIHHV